MCDNGVLLFFIYNNFVFIYFFGQCCCFRIRWYLSIFPNVISLRLWCGYTMRNRSIWNYGSWNIEDFLKSKDMNTFASFRMLWIKVVHCQLPIIVKCNEIQLNYSANKTKIVILLYRITKQNKQTHRATWKTKESRQISHKPATDKAFTKSWGKVKHSFAKINDTKQQKWH